MRPVACAARPNTTLSPGAAPHPSFRWVPGAGSPTAGGHPSEWVPGRWAFSAACSEVKEIAVRPSEAVIAIILALLAAPVPSDGQQPAKVYRIGWLGVSPPAATDTAPQRCPIKGVPNWQAFVEG